MASDSNPTEALTSCIQSIKDPLTGKSLSRDAIQIDSLTDQSAKIQVEFGTHSSPLADDLSSRVDEVVKTQFANLQTVDVSLNFQPRKVTAAGQIGLTAQSIIAVGSGKGGVGKSTVATTLALTLKALGARVGLLDTDVYGPSVPILLGASGQPAVVDNQIQPIDHDGMPVMSIGFMVPADDAVIWRGPMLHKYVGQFLGGTNWGELDYLIIDMPPGTGDVALSLSQMLPVTGSVIVCTPQDVALADAIKAASMFQQVKIPIAGIVENMSGFVCPGCGKEYDIFGKGGAKEFAENRNIAFLGSIPIQMPLRERGDQGATAENITDPTVFPYLKRIAYQLAKFLADQTLANPPKPQLPILG